MPALQIRDLPAAIYKLLKQAAAREKRSLSQQAIVALEKGLQPEAGVKTRREQILRKMKQNRWPADLPDPVVLIRQDRDR